MSFLRLPVFAHRVTFNAQCSVATDQTFRHHCACPRYRSDRACHHAVPRFRLTPQNELLVPFVCVLLHMAAIHSHGWRCRLVRLNKLQDPTRSSLNISGSLVGRREKLARFRFAGSGLAGGPSDVCIMRINNGQTVIRPPNLAVTTGQSGTAMPKACCASA